MEIIEINEQCSVDKKKMIALELPESLYQRLRKEAFDNEVSLSAMVRHIVRNYFFDEEVDK